MFQWAGVSLNEEEWYLINKAIKVISERYIKLNLGNIHSNWL
jgi:hypothetical protein